MSNNETLIHNAISWAKTYLGSTEYCFRCLGFIEDALERSNSIEIFGGNSAKESADMYEANKNIDSPPKGAFVFYDCSGVIPDLDENSINYGHVGLSLGNGELIHAWDKVRIDNYLDIENLSAAPGWSQPKLIGWVSIERVLKGFQKRTW